MITVCLTNRTDYLCDFSLQSSKLFFIGSLGWSQRNFIPVVSQNENRMLWTIGKYNSGEKRIIKYEVKKLVIASLGRVAGPIALTKAGFYMLVEFEYHN